MTPLTSLKQIAIAAARKRSIDEALFQALIHHESGNWNEQAQRYEPAFYKRYIEPLNITDTNEARLRATSIGLTQIMGQVAREQGYTGSLASLFEPKANCEQGAAKLARCLQKALGDVREALLHYNGGANRDYPDLVLAHIEEYRR